MVGLIFKHYGGGNSSYTGQVRYPFLSFAYYVSLDLPRHCARVDDPIDNSYLLNRAVGIGIIHS